MRPLSLFERHVGDATVSFRELLDGNRPAVGGRSPLALGEYVDEIVAGGFPGMRHLAGRALFRQLDSYLATIVDRDLPEVGFTVRRPATVKAWLRAYAAATATTTSWEKIRDASTSGRADKPAKTTTIPYIELLTALRILDPIEAWLPTSNHLATLTAAPKHHLADPALAARLLDRSRQHLLAGDEGNLGVPRDGTLLGGLFESLSALSIRTFAQSADARTCHLRTQGGRHEIDFIVERGGGVLALEVKLSGTVDDRDVRHLTWLRDKLGDDLIDAAVLTTGTDAYRRRDGIAVIPLGLLGP
jgi:predicted AAA+ superfamily ATPase